MRGFLELSLEDPSKKNTKETEVAKTRSLPLWDMYKHESNFIVPYIIESNIGWLGFVRFLQTADGARRRGEISV